jgi:hypothetical protein
MPTGERPLPPKPSRGGTSAALTAILALAAVGGVVYFTQRAERRPRVNEDPLPQITALAQAEKDAEWLKRAIRGRQAILGMTYREVEMAKGRPQLKQRGGSLPDILRARGGVENWIYDLGGGNESNVLFGQNGFVIQSSDVGDKPGPGQAIRQ